MSQDNAVFSFELNESLYFERGQGVDEILGISLEPEISIQPFNDYISIRGVIELNGNYQRVHEADIWENNPDDSDDFSSKRYVEQVFDGERGELSFSHRFPVEISVPIYRVNDMNDVTVSVEYFDYEIPDQNQLRLTSVIAIQGINDSVENPANSEVSEEITEQKEEGLAFNKEDSFRFDIKEQFAEPEIKNEQQKEETEELVRPENTVEVEQQEEEQYEEAQREKEPHEEEKIEEPSEVEEVEFHPSQQETKLQQPQSTAEDRYDEEVELVEETHSNSPKSSLKSTEKNKMEDTDGERIDYLSNIFREDEESYSKMRLCIVQDNDTIETIAERYRVNPLQISKQNHLDDETISEGQLLYIPFKQ
ncbi:stage VI sporulation protein D [Virgibacillus phasianinus]|uniref:stage VI sporulation protein D n=1 Tax=Virgibacillus phasianinus TaxID=2017483 RepID=UPI0012FD694A|nr:stage VI sporulation protein D [Virgibacillus phasianinus]